MLLMFNDRINRMLDTLNSIPNINMGGCGVAAIATYRWLKKNNLLPKNFKMYFIYSEPKLFNRNYTKVVKKDFYSVYPHLEAPNHVIFTINGKTTDSTRKSYNLKKLKYYHEITITQLIQSLNAKEQFQFIWNYAFCRSETLPIIEKKLGISLKPINKYLYAQ